MNELPTGGKKDAYHHRDLQQALLDTALQVLEERNGPHFSLREIAAKIGVTHAAAYRHYESKDHLLEALVGMGFARLHDYQEIEKAKAASDSLNQLYALHEAYVRFALENPGFFSLMFGSTVKKEERADTREQINAAALSGLTGAIRNCQDDGYIIPGDPRRIAGYLVMAPHGFACYSAQDRALICAAEDLMQPRALAEVALNPILTKPLTPAEMSERYFRGGNAS